MSLYLPPELSWLGWIAGGAWPEGDEDKAWAVSDAYKNAAAALRTVIPDIEDAKRTAVAAYPEGTGGENIAEMFDLMLEGDQSMETLAHYMEQISDAAFDFGTQIEAAKLMTILSLVALAIEIAWAWVFPPTAAAVQAAEEVATQSIVRILARQLQQRITAKVVQIFGEKFAGLAKNWILKIIEAALISGGLDAAVQLGQMAKGHRKHFDWKEFGASVGSAGLGAPFGRIGANFLNKQTTKFLGDKLKNPWVRAGNGAIVGMGSGIVEYGFGSVGAAMITGDWAGTFGNGPGWVGGAARGGITGGVKGYRGINRPDNKSFEIDFHAPKDGSANIPKKPGFSFDPGKLENNGSRNGGGGENIPIQDRPGVSNGGRGENGSTHPAGWTENNGSGGRQNPFADGFSRNEPGGNENSGSTRQPPSVTPSNYNGNRSGGPSDSGRNSQTQPANGSKAVGPKGDSRSQGPRSTFGGSDRTASQAPPNSTGSSGNSNAATGSRTGTSNPFGDSRASSVHSGSSDRPAGISGQGRDGQPSTQPAPGRDGSVQFQRQPGSPPPGDGVQTSSHSKAPETNPATGQSRSPAPVSEAGSNKSVTPPRSSAASETSSVAPSRSSEAGPVPPGRSAGPEGGPEGGPVTPGRSGGPETGPVPPGRSAGPEGGPVTPGRSGGPEAGPVPPGRSAGPEAGSVAPPRSSAASDAGTGQPPRAASVSEVSSSQPSRRPVGLNLDGQQQHPPVSDNAKQTRHPGPNPGPGDEPPVRRVPASASDAGNLPPSRQRPPESNASGITPHRPEGDRPSPRGSVPQEQHSVPRGHDDAGSDGRGGRIPEGEADHPNWTRTKDGETLITSPDGTEHFVDKHGNIFIGRSKDPELIMIRPDLSFEWVPNNGKHVAPEPDPQTHTPGRPEDFSFRRDDGTEHTLLDDGSVQTKSWDNSITIVKRDGGAELRSHWDERTHFDPNGTAVHTAPGDPAIVTRPDNTVHIVPNDKMGWQRDGDGNLVITSPDGTKHKIDGDGNITVGRDGDPQLMKIGADNAIVFVGPDSTGPAARSGGTAEKGVAEKGIAAKVFGGGIAERIFGGKSTAEKGTGVQSPTFTRPDQVSHTVLDGGTVQTKSPDGWTTTVKRNGATEFESPTGDKTVFKADNTVVESGPGKPTVITGPGATKQTVEHNNNVTVELPDNTRHTAFEATNVPGSGRTEHPDHTVIHYDVKDTLKIGWRDRLGGFDQEGPHKPGIYHMDRPDGIGLESTPKGIKVFGSDDKVYERGPRGSVHITEPNGRTETRSMKEPIDLGNGATLERTPNGFRVRHADDTVSEIGPNGASFTDTDGVARGVRRDGTVFVNDPKNDVHEIRGDGAVRVTAEDGTSWGSRPDGTSWTVDDKNKVHVTDRDGNEAAPTERKSPTVDGADLTAKPRPRQVREDDPLPGGYQAPRGPTTEYFIPPGTDKENVPPELHYVDPPDDDDWDPPDRDYWGPPDRDNWGPDQDNWGPPDQDQWGPPNPYVQDQSGPGPGGAGSSNAVPYDRNPGPGNSGNGGGNSGGPGTSGGPRNSGGPGNGGDSYGGRNTGGGPGPNDGGGSGDGRDSSGNDRTPPPEDRRPPPPPPPQLDPEMLSKMLQNLHGAGDMPSPDTDGASSNEEGADQGTNGQDEPSPDFLSLGPGGGLSGGANAAAPPDLSALRGALDQLGRSGPGGSGAAGSGTDGSGSGASGQENATNQPGSANRPGAGSHSGTQDSVPPQRPGTPNQQGGSESDRPGSQRDADGQQRDPKNTDGGNNADAPRQGAQPGDRSGTSGSENQSGTPGSGDRSGAQGPGEQLGVGNNADAPGAEKNSDGTDPSGRTDTGDRSGTPGSGDRSGTQGSDGHSGTPGSGDHSGTLGSDGKSGTPGSGDHSGTHGPDGQAKIPEQHGNSASGQDGTQSSVPGRPPMSAMQDGHPSSGLSSPAGAPPTPGAPAAAAPPPGGPPGSPKSKERKPRKKNDKQRKPPKPFLLPSPFDAPEQRAGPDESTDDAPFTLDASSSVTEPVIDRRTTTQTTRSTTDG
ncbi:hypothetical protein ACIA8C_23350 [Nocardia sp. NPDC051321]|uniref:WXG100-like domain-containing protein n=1 Tax=Nocardia sp. NPDC051321 TaxID=3364323 RepID=UPI0037A5E640